MCSADGAGALVEALRRARDANPPAHVIPCFGPPRPAIWRGPTASSTEGTLLHEFSRKNFSAGKPGGSGVGPGYTLEEEAKGNGTKTLEVSEDDVPLTYRFPGVPQKYCESPV